MRILIDIGHPAHVHFFRCPIEQLKALGHEILVTSRDKEIALELLNEFGLTHEQLSTQTYGGLLALAKELWQRDRALLSVVRRYRPDVMAAIGGIFIAHIGRLTGIPSIVFYDTENAVLQNLLTYPFATRVVVPRCYEGWVPGKKQLRYPGYHELSYLHPNQFSPDREVAIRNGLSSTGDTYLIRLVSWQASHDMGERGWSVSLLARLIQKLTGLGKVIISAEGTLPEDLETYRYKGKVTDIHHVLAFCRAYIGESATMASEAAVLGVPAIYAANTGRGYVHEQETRYGLVKNIKSLDWPVLEAAVDTILEPPLIHWQQARAELLQDTIDTAAFISEQILAYDRPDTSSQISQA